jgi:hypothetical protein
LATTRPLQSVILQSQIKLNCIHLDNQTDSRTTISNHSSEPISKHVVGCCSLAAYGLYVLLVCCSYRRRMDPPPDGGLLPLPLLPAPSLRAFRLQCGHAPPWAAECKRPRLLNSHWTELNQITNTKPNPALLNNSIHLPPNQSAHVAKPNWANRTQPRPLAGLLTRQSTISYAPSPPECKL